MRNDDDAERIGRRTLRGRCRPGARGWPLAWAMLGLVAGLAAPFAANAAEPIVAYTITDGSRIDESLTGRPGDPARGRVLFGSERVGCAACHSLAGEAGGSLSPSASPSSSGAGDGDAPEGADVLVPLDGAGARWSEGGLRLWLVAPAVLRPGSVMPGFYLAGQRREADDPLYNGPRLTAEEVEDLVAWLKGL